jgi:hypothetical protein
MDPRSFFAKSMQLTRSAASLFHAAGVGRETNDSWNKLREQALVTLYSTQDPTLQPIRAKWHRALSTLCSHPYDDVLVKLRGGRSANYDFELVFLAAAVPVHTVKAEFKHNAKSIDSLPEYFSPAADKAYFPRLYADAFYDSLDEICAIYPGLSEHKPDRETYVRLVHNNSYDRHPFFRTLYNMETSGTAEQKRAKQAIVHESIHTYLTNHVDKLNLQLLTSDIQERQSGKTFILWDLDDFRVDTLQPDELVITHVERIKNKNTIVAVSKSGTKHNMLLRWKNHLGVLYPAWQISLTR